jgi:hypothetical protein
MCFPGQRLPMKGNHPANLFEEMRVEKSLNSRNDVISYTLFTLLPFSSLLLFAAVWGRDAVARRNGVPLVYSYSTTLIFLQASKIWVCTLYLFLLIHTASQFILFYSPRALLLLLGLQLCILSPEGGVECSVSTPSASWDSHSNEYFHNTECLLQYFFLFSRVPVSRLGPG